MFKTFLPIAAVAPSPPTPSVAGSGETMTLGGLEPGTTYRVVVISRDESGAASYASNVAVVTTQAAPDVTAPGAVQDLNARALTGAGQLTPATASSWSNEQLPDFSAGAATDGDRSTAWSAVESSASDGAWIRLDIGDVRRVDRVQVWPAAGLEGLFAPDFEIRVSPDGLTWTTVAAVTGHRPTGQVPYDARFAATTGRYVEYRATQLASYGNGLYYAVVAEIDVHEAAPLPGSVAFNWTAPGDDDDRGQATSYALAIGPCPFDAATATQVATASPLAAGSPERYGASGLAAGTYCVNVTATDEVGNVSGASNVAQVTVAP